MIAKVSLLIIFFLFLLFSISGYIGNNYKTYPIGQLLSPCRIVSDFAVLVFALGVQLDFLSALFFHFRPVLLSHGNANKKLKKLF